MSTALLEWEAGETRAERRRWSFSAGAVLAAYSLLLAAHYWQPARDAPPVEMAAMMVEMAPQPVIPPEPQPEPPPEPPPPEPVVKPLPTPAPPRVEAPPVSDIALPEPEPQEVAETSEEVVAEPPPPRVDPARAASARITYEGLLLAHLERNKRYPRIAQSRRQEGVPYVRFVATRDGKVLSAKLERSSGHASLDEEALALLERAQPLPPFTEEMLEAQLEMIVPIQFFLRRR